VATEDGPLASIGQGFLVLVGVAPGDTEEVADRMADKVRALRVSSRDERPLPARRASSASSAPEV